LIRPQIGKGHERTGKRCINRDTQTLSPEALQQQRYDKFRRMGRFLEAGQVQESAV
jgi:hypothetical protein